jgi:hypothetical protein
MKKKSIFSAVLSLAAMTLFGCGGGGGGGGGATPAPVAGSTTITGVAAKGPINGGTVKVFAIFSSGKVNRTAEIGSGTTDSNGNFTVTIPPDKKAQGGVLVEVTGGTFNDEASGVQGVKLNVPLQAAVSSIADGAKVAVTPLTHLAANQVAGIGNFSKQEIDDANKQIGDLFQVGDIIQSQPFDPTKDAPAGATDDQKKYATALGVFSQLCDKRRGANKLEDSLGDIFKGLDDELNANGGFAGATLADLNTAIDDFNKSGKNKGGLAINQIVFKGGVLQLQTTGTLPANSSIEGLDFTIKLPAGVSVNLKDPATGEVADGVVAPTSKAATGSLNTARFDSTANTLHIILINIQPGIDVGEFAHIEFLLAANTTLPAKTDFTLTVNTITGGNTSNTTGFVDLKASGIDINQKSVAGI